MHLYDAMLDPLLFGKTFGGPTFAAWRTVAKILDALPLTDEEQDLYRALTGRTDLPRAPFLEAYLVKPRRSGGTLFGAACGVHAALTDYRDKLGPGEVATIALIAADRRQARQLRNFCRGLIEDSELIRSELESETEMTLRFKHGTQIEIMTGSFRSTRGYSFAACLLDELAWMRDDTSANPDTELVRAVRPGLANLKGRLLGFSSPHSKRGHLYAMYRSHYGQPSNVLIIQAGRQVLNPTISSEMIEQARKEDPVAARSEWDGEFREDINTFIDEELIEAAVNDGVRERPYFKGTAYVAWVDSSGGRHDAFTLAIAHRETEGKDERLVLDRLLVQDPPFDPEVVTRRFCEVIAGFRMSAVMGDRYGGEWVASMFVKCGIKYEAAELDKSAIYIECLPLFSQKRIDLLDDPRLITELKLLERRPRMGGKPDVVDHPPRSRDDLANSACGALWLASTKKITASWRPERSKYALT